MHYSVELVFLVKGQGQPLYGQAKVSDRIKTALKWKENLILNLTPL